jgi:hypothetical protein
MDHGQSALMVSPASGISQPLSAFAQDVVTAVHGAVDVVKGSLDAELEPALQQLGDAGRVVAFRS